MVAVRLPRLASALQASSALTCSPASRGSFRVFAFLPPAATLSALLKRVS